MSAAAQREALALMGKRFDFIDRLQARTALLAIGRSTLRNQGAPGVVAAARRYLRVLDLRDFSVTTRVQFASALEKHTHLLMKRFPRETKDNWGAARKALNIFLRDVVYNRPLCEHHRLSHLEPWLELPLDSNAYDGLVEDSAGNYDVPAWPGVKALDRSVSAELQTIADAIAKCLNTRRVHLDVRYWRKGRSMSLRANQRMHRARGSGARAPLARAGDAHR